MATIKIIALLPLFRFSLPQSEGQEVEVDEVQGNEIIELGYARLASEVEAEEAAAKAALEAEIAAETAAKLADSKIPTEAEAKAVADAKAAEEAALKAKK